jgi:3-methyl-2-oxobutanoate hydroxymethyltransferase
MEILQTKQRTDIESIRKLKGGTPLVCLTAYTAPVAKLLDAHCDILLVGDSLAMVIYGLETTAEIDLDTMIRHGAAVVRASSKAAIVVDMPAGSYEISPCQAAENASRLISETGAGAVKLEGGIEMAETIAAIVKCGVPVMGHIGLLPQRIKKGQGFKITGQTDQDARRLVKDAYAITEAGAFAMVIEGTVEPVARDITAQITIPTIGIGASVHCDGQILVTDDLVGVFTEFKPKFVKRYANVAQMIDQAAGNFAADVRARRFPDADHLYACK